MSDTQNRTAANEAIEKLDRHLAKALARIRSARDNGLHHIGPVPNPVARTQADASHARSSPQSLYAILAQGLHEDLEALRKSFANLVSSIDQDFARDRYITRPPSVPSHDNGVPERRRIGEGDYV